jgi:hypothetical protein
VLAAPAVLLPCRAQHEALLDPVGAPGERVERLRQVLGVDLAEVAQPAEVGAQHRDAERRGEPQAAEHGAVPAEGEDEVASVRQLIELTAPDAGRQAPVVDGRELGPGPLRPRGDLLDGVLDVAPGMQDEADPSWRCRLAVRRRRIHRSALQHTTPPP